MFNFITPPKDLSKRSLNTQIQWVILIMIKTFASIFISAAGIFYVLYLAGIISQPPTTSQLMVVALTATGVSFVLAGVLALLNKKSKKLTETIEKTKQTLKENFEKEAYKEYIQGKTPYKKKMVEIHFPDLNKEMVIGLEYKPVPGVEDDEIIKDIIYQCMFIRTTEELLSKDFIIRNCTQ